MVFLILKRIKYYFVILCFVFLVFERFEVYFVMMLKVWLRSMVRSVLRFVVMIVVIMVVDRGYVWVYCVKVNRCFYLFFMLLGLGVLSGMFWFDLVLVLSFFVEVIWVYLGGEFKDIGERGIFFLGGGDCFGCWGIFSWGILCILCWFMLMKCVR